MALRQRNDPVRLFGRRLVIVGLLILVVMAVFGVWNAYQKQHESAALRTEAEVQLADLSKRQAKLNSDVTNLQTDRGMEAALREQYALGAMGEGLIVIIDPPKPVPIQATSTIFEKIKQAFRWW